MPGGDPGEFEFIRSRLAPLTEDAAGAGGLRDDGALIDLGPGERLAVTSDILIENKHFPEDADPALVARRALRVNLSDLAAMGARPFAFTTSVAWPKKRFSNLHKGFLEGLQCDQEVFGARLIGGDSTSVDKGAWTISITAFGRCPTGFDLRRYNARCGDLLVVTGAIGDASLGLRLLTEGWAPSDPRHKTLILDRYYKPEPRINVGLAARRLANAAIDVSDGLLSEIRHLAVESGLSARVDLRATPLSEAGRAWLELSGLDRSALIDLTTAGDDYELVLAVPRSNLEAMKNQCAALNTPLTVIGSLEANTAGGPIQVFDGETQVQPDRLGFTHF